MRITLTILTLVLTRVFCDPSNISMRRVRDKRSSPTIKRILDNKDYYLHDRKSYEQKNNNFFPATKKYQNDTHLLSFYKKKPYHFKLHQKNVTAKKYALEKENVGLEKTTNDLLNFDSNSCKKGRTKFFRKRYLTWKNTSECQNIYQRYLKMSSRENDVEIKEISKKYNYSCESDKYKQCSNNFINNLKRKSQFDKIGENLKKISLTSYLVGHCINKTDSNTDIYDFLKASKKNKSSLKINFIGNSLHNFKFVKNKSGFILIEEPSIIFIKKPKNIRFFLNKKMYNNQSYHDVKKKKLMIELAPYDLDADESVANKYYEENDMQPTEEDVQGGGIPLDNK